MKKILYFIFFLTLADHCTAQSQPQIEASVVQYFNELKEACSHLTTLWNKDLYGPILLVDPGTRVIYANEGDQSGVLQLKGKIYSGILPQEINFANTALDWNGKRWAMIMLPLPQNKHDRINLLAHESFHRVQPELGFRLNNAENKHLDQREGRISLRLEMEALKKALNASGKNDIKRHLTNALFFRKYRYQEFEQAEVQENALEINEGIAEFTGMLVSGRQQAETVNYLVEGMDRLLKNRTFVRSFAYQTTPSYGYILYKRDKHWNKKIDASSNLTTYFMQRFAIQIPNLTAGEFEQRSLEYQGNTIVEEENVRHANNRIIVDKYRKLFVESPHFDVIFETMNYSFDPRSILPIDQHGTYYPTVRITDVWGVLTVENGALMSPDWKKISLTPPSLMEKNLIKGDGWVLELKEGHSAPITEQAKN